MPKLGAYRWAVGGAVAVAALAMVHVLAACAFPAWGPDYGPVNWLDTSPGAYAAGHLGIIHANAGVRDLVVAWRYLAGRPLSAAEQEQFTSKLPQERRVAGGRPEVTAAEPWVALVGQGFPLYAGAHSMRRRRLRESIARCRQGPSSTRS